MDSATASTGTRQADHFGAMAADWWNPKGSSAMLHRLNPVRLKYIRTQIDAHWSADPRGRMPLAGKRALDMGCGPGLLAEPLARLGATVTGVDAAAESIVVARDHANTSGVTIDYRVGGIEAVLGEHFDLITCLEVVEHVDDPAAFIRSLAALLVPDGLLILSTPNRTPLTKLVLIDIGETIGGIPHGTHEWNKFLTPEELTAHFEAAGLHVMHVKGVGFHPTTGFALSDNRQMDYLVTARPA